jgi:hypothetical protein
MCEENRPDYKTGLQTKQKRKQSEEELEARWCKLKPRCITSSPNQSRLQAQAIKHRFGVGHQGAGRVELKHLTPIDHGHPIAL